MSSRHSRPTTRRPSQTHSGLPAGPFTSAAGFGELVDLALGLLGGIGRLGGGRLVAALGIAALGEGGQEQTQTPPQQMTAKLKRTKKDMAGPVEFGSLLFRD